MKLEPTSIKITEEHQGQRLDHFLVELKPEMSRTQIQKLIKEELILVNGKPSTVHCFLKADDEIQIRDKDTTVKEIKPIKKVSNAKKIEEVKELFAQVKIVFENDDFLVIEKPSGLLVHAAPGNDSLTLVDWLLGIHPELSKIGEDPERPSIVHRLDKEVSGLMVIPKTQDSFDYFKKLFKIRALDKKYTALVDGDVIADEGAIDFPISRSKTKPGLFAARPNNQEGKTALTNFFVTKHYKNYTLLQVEIMTGRTHQIRVHLSAYGYPIVADPLYGKETKVKPARIFLHASRLAFVGPDGKNYEFQSPLPKELSFFLLALKDV